MNPKKFVKKPVVVEAIQVPEEFISMDSFEDVRQFCDCEVVKHWDNGEYVFYWLVVNIHPLASVKAYEEDWIVKDHNGKVSVLEDEEFKKWFDEVENVDNP